MNPVQIVFRNMNRSPALEWAIHRKADKLFRYCDRITDCRVVVEAPHRRQQKGNLYQIRIALSLPGADLIADRDTGTNHDHEDAYVAIRDAFAAVTRELSEYLSKRRQLTRAS